MKNMLKAYFTHYSIWLYIVMAAGVLTYLLATGVFADYWYYALIPIPLAPLYEWLAHKYILHWNIGTIQELEREPGKDYTVGDKMNIVHGGKTLEGKIIAVDDQQVTVGTGFAAISPAFYHFMDDMHYHHHRDPDYVPLIFAPPIVAVLLFIKMFAICYLISWNFDLTMGFLLGVIVYYLFYEWMHLGHHVKGYTPLTAYGRMMKKAHQLHHYKNENYWWGITNPVGDMLLGTFKENNEVPKSETVKTVNT